MTLINLARFDRHSPVISPVPAPHDPTLPSWRRSHSCSLKEIHFSLLWPESTAAAAHKNLRNTLWAIRTALGSEVLHTGERLALSDAVWVDVRTFSDLAERVSTLVVANSPPSTWTTVITSAQRALVLYRGPLLDGLELADAPDFELWLTSARERIEALHMRLLQSLVTAHRALHHWSDVLSVARRALEHDICAITRVVGVRSCGDTPGDWC